MEITIKFVQDEDEIFYACVCTAIRHMKLPKSEHIAPGAITLTVTVKDPLQAMHFGMLTERMRTKSFLSIPTNF